MDASEGTPREVGWDLVGGSFMAFEDCGEHALKGVRGEWRLLEVTSP